MLDELRLDQPALALLEKASRTLFLQRRPQRRDLPLSSPFESRTREPATGVSVLHWNELANEWNKVSTIGAADGSLTLDDRTCATEADSGKVSLMSPQLEMTIRLGAFFGVLVVMSFWEWLAPRRQLTVKKGARWCSNLALVVANTVVVRVVVPVTAVAAASYAASKGWGLLNLVSWPNWLELTLAVLLLDLLIYLQHVVFHRVPVLWRLHKVHHADLDIDVTTGIRFHTIEILLSALLKLAAVVLLGPPAAAVVVFEVVLNATSMFNHSNVKLPLPLDRIVRQLLVTPDMHRVHHSVIREETNSNFGFNLPWWDRLLGTYRDQPHEGHVKMKLGLAEIRDEAVADRLPGMLIMPFVKAAVLADEQNQ